MFAIDSLPFFIQPASLLYFDIHYHKLFEHYSLNVNNEQTIHQYIDVAQILIKTTIFL